MTHVSGLGLSAPVLFQKVERHTAAPHEDDGLVDQSEAGCDGTLGHIAYEAILKAKSAGD